MFDQDKDYIWDPVAGGFESDAFDVVMGESDVNSLRITDQHLDGITFGRVVESAGL